jgi:ankyrin repeat protein
MTDAANTRMLDELAEAVRKNDVKAMEALLQRGANPNEEIHDGWSLLLQAASDGHTGIVRLLIAAGADVNKKNRNGVTPLMMAADSCSTETARALIDGGARVNALNDYGATALIYAISVGALEGAREFISLLIEQGADVSKAPTIGDTPMSLAEKFGYPELAKLLKEAPELQRRRAEEAESRIAEAKAHVIALERQQRLKPHAPTVVIRRPQP